MNLKDFRAYLRRNNNNKYKILNFQIKIQIKKLIWIFQKQRKLRNLTIKSKNLYKI